MPIHFLQHMKSWSFSSLFLTSFLWTLLNTDPVLSVLLLALLFYALCHLILQKPANIDVMLKPTKLEGLYSHTLLNEAIKQTVTRACFFT